MKIKVLLLSSAVMLMFMLNACVRPQEKLQKEIEASEQALTAVGDAMPSIERSDSLIKMYLHYADQYKDDTLSPVYIFRAADLCMKTGRYEQAVAHYGQVQRYKGFRKLGEALFLQGFISDSQLGDTASARKYYQQFLAAYPQHEFADDAQHLIENLDLTADQLIQKLQQSQRLDSLTVDHH